MERMTRLRATILLLLFGVVMIFFAFKLYDLQIIETGGKTDNITTFETRTGYQRQHHGDQPGQL